MIKSILLALMLVISVPCYSDGSIDTSSIITWLEIVDSGNYTESWNQAAPFFQKQVTGSQWQQALSKVRTPLEKMMTRKVIKSSKHESLPRVPKGEYAVISIATSFEHKKTAVETVTVQKVKEQWRVIGYFIK